MLTRVCCVDMRVLCWHACVVLIYMCCLDTHVLCWHARGVLIYMCSVDMRVLCCSLVPEEAPKKEYVFKNKKEAIEAFKALLRERVRSLLSPSLLYRSISYTGFDMYA